MKPATADIALVAGNRIKGSVQLSSPYFDDIALTIMHKGQLKSFRNKMNLIYSKKQKISSDFNFRLAKVMKATLVFASPFKGYKKIVANVKHEGSWKNFKCDANLKVGKDVIKANMKTSVGSKFNWLASVETPFAGWKRMNAAISHEGTLSNFRCHAELARGKENMLGGDVKFSIKPTIDIMVAAQTPFAGYKNLKAAFSHQKVNQKTKSHAEITYFKKDTISSDIVIDIPTGSVEVTVTTPFKKYDRMVGSFSHVGKSTSFSTKMKFAMNKNDEFTAETNFNSVGQLSAEMKITTPFRDYQSTELSFTQSGSLNNFRSRANMLFNKKKCFADITFNSLSGVEGQFLLHTPLFDNVEATIYHSNDGKLKSSATINYGKQTLLDANLLFKQSASTFGTAYIKLLKVPKVETSFEYEGRMFNNKANMQVAYGKDRIVVEAEMSTKSDMTGKLTISTPFKSANTMYFIYSKTGPLANLNGHLEVGINEEKITADATYTDDDIKKATFSVRTPFSSLRHADFSVRFAGTIRNFDSHAEATVNGHMIEGDFTATISDAVDIVGSLKTPYTSDVVLKIIHYGTITNFKSSSEISYGQKKASAQFSMDLTNGVQVDAVISSPFNDDIIMSSSTNDDFGNFRSLSQITYSGAKQHEVELTFTYTKDPSSVRSTAQAVYNGKAISGKFDAEGELPAFRSKLDVSCMDKKLVAELQFDLKGLEGQFSLSTTFTSDLLVTFNHDGSMTDFRVTGKIAYGNKIHVAKVLFNHAGSFKQFTTNGEITYNDQTASVEISFDTTNIIEGKFILKTPLADDIVIAFSHEGHPLNFKTCLKVTYMGSLQHDASFTFNHDGSILQFNTKGSLNYNRKLISTAASFDTTKIVEGKIELKTPVMDDIVIAFSTEGSRKNFKTCLKVTYSGSLQHDASLTFSHEGPLMKFNTKGTIQYNKQDMSVAISFDATKDIEGKLTVRTPISDDIIVAFSHEGQYKNFKTCLKITYGGALQHDASVVFKHNGSIRKFRTILNTVYNGEECSAEAEFDMTSAINGNLHLKSAWMKDTSVSFSHQRKPLSFKMAVEYGKAVHIFQTTFDMKKDENSVQTSMEAIYNGNKISAVGSVDHSDGVDGNLMLKSPWTEDITVAGKYNGNALDLIAELQIDYKGARQHEFQARHNLLGDLSKFSTSASVSYNGKAISFDGSYNSVDNKMAQLVFKSPFTEDSKMKLSLDGTRRQFTATADLSYGEISHSMILKSKLHTESSKFGVEVEMTCNRNAASFKILIDCTDDYNLHAVFTSPYTKDFDMSATAQVKRNLISGSAKVNLAGNSIHNSRFSLTRRMSENQFSAILVAEYNSKIIKGDISLVSFKGIDAKMTIETPFAGFEKSSANFLYEIDGQSITAQFNGKLGSQNVEINAALDRTSPMTATVSFKSSFSGYTDISLNVNFNDNPTNFRLTSDLSCENRNIYDLTFEHRYTTSVIQGSMELKTAILEDINIQYDLLGSLKKSSMSISASIGSDNYIRSNTMTNIKERQSAEFKTTMDINVAGFMKTVEVELIGGRTFNDFSSKLSGKIDSKTVAVEAVYKSQPTEIALKVETPFESAQSMSVVLKNSRRANFMSASAVVTLSPKKIYEMNLNFFNQYFQKIDIKVEVKTPIRRHELMRWVYRHDINTRFTLFTDYECSTGFKATGDITLSNQAVKIEVNTPFQKLRSLAIKGKLEKQSKIYNIESSLAVNEKSMKSSIFVDLQSQPMTTRIQISNPFKGFESSEINLSCAGDIQDLRATVDLITPFTKPINSEVRVHYSSPFQMETTAILATGIKNFENIRLSFVNQKQGNQYQSHIETRWNKEMVVALDASCDVSELFNGKQVKSTISISTPLTTLRSMTISLGKKYSPENYMQSVFIEHNSNKILDIDASYSRTEQRTVSIVTRHPRPMHFQISGNRDTARTNADISLNWDTNKSDSNINLEAFYGHNENKCNLIVKMIHPLKSVGLRGELERSNSHDLVSFDVSVDDSDVFGYTYDCKHSSDNRDTSMKLRLPSRSLMVSNGIERRLGSKMVIGSFYWDADRDQTKKISVKGDITPSDNGIDANIVLEMPSIGQDVKLDSQVQYNKGKVVFDGKTELRYSRDSMKTLVLTSRLEDQSSGTDTNYSFSVGIKHPYTTIDVEMTSVLQTSDVIKMASVDVKYQTADKVNRNFGLMLEINNLKNTLEMKLASPIKTINIEGQVKTTAPYKVSFKNLYDDVKPVNAEVVFDPSAVSLDVNMNYDIENPQNTLHINAKLAEESGVTAEVFRNVESGRISDTLIKLRLKTSKILHTSINWNPDLLKTVKSAGLNKIRKYGNGINRAIQTSWMAIEQEVQAKHSRIVAAVSEDMKPFTNFLSDRITELERMISNNDFYFNDIVRHFQSTHNMIRRQIKLINKELHTLAKDIDMDLINLYLAELTQMIQMIEDMSEQYYAQVLDLVQSQTSQLSQTIEAVYTKYGRRVTDTISSVSTNKILESVRARLPHLPINQISDQYSTVIYNARETINSGLVSVLPTPVYHMASSAYKYWEIEDNIQSAFVKFVNFIKKDIENQFRNIKDLITDVKKTKITVYDPVKGHFEMDIYLPLEMKSLTEVKEITNPLESLRSLIPQSNPLPSLSEIWSHTSLPEFGAHAYINGDHFTTFDGQTFDFSGRCSYVLARDFGKDKFSIILNYMGRQNKKLIVMSATQTVQVTPNGKVRIDGVETKMPYGSDELTVAQVGDNIFIDGHGFSMINNVKADTYDIEISHWFHGRTAGLLGIHDNERFNDMMTSDRHITSDPYALANTWQVQDKCR